MRVYVDKYRHPTIPVEYDDHRDILMPYEVENIDYIKDQILYRNSLILEADGETFQIWRRKREGEQCDNPDCGASQDVNGTPNASCSRCLGVGYIDGYDYAGETLIRIAPAGLQFQITPNGLMKVHNPRTWTYPEPIILTQDILIAVDQQRLVQERRVVDKNLNRRVDQHSDFDSLNDTGISKILKVTDMANASAAYKEDIDYTLSNNGVLWLNNPTSRRPGDLEDYFVTYVVSKSYMRRYEVGEVIRSTWRGIILHQEMTINELEVTHVAYDNISAESYDNTRYLYPFPYSNWFERANT